MLFSSITFIYIFLPLLLAFYFITKNDDVRNVVLLIFSLIFYAWGEPVYILLLLILSLLNFILSYIVSQKIKYLSTFIFILTIIIDISSILYFKYINLIIDTINYIKDVNIKNVSVSLPLGISFFTFQLMSYVIDVRKEKVNVQDSLVKFMLYISLFPQLIAGPIIRYSDIENQLDKRVCTPEGFVRGAYRFGVGLFKKVMIANALGEIATTFNKININEISVFAIWCVAILYTLQLYFDFSGYSDMAIGLSKIFGFEFPENFNYPYISTSIREYWKRWHISLSRFFRDYVYIPLGGNRKHQIFNLFVVFLLTGIWHGASYNFILWGLFHFIFVSLEKMFRKNLKDGNENIGMKIFGYIYTMFIIILASNIFYRTDLTDLLSSFKIMFFLSKNTLTDVYSISVLRENFFIILVAIISMTPIFKIIIDKISKIETLEIILKTALVVLLVGISTFELLSNSYNPFLYFRF